VDPAKLHDAKIIAAYLDRTGVPVSTPVIVVVDDRGPLPGASVSFMRDHVFAVFPIDRLVRTYVFLGDPNDLLAGRPSTLEGNPSYSSQSAHFLKLASSALAHDPVALISGSFNQAHYGAWAQAQPGSVIPGTDVAVVRGPAPPATFPPVPLALRQPTVVQLALLSMFGLGALALIGLGWAGAMLRRWLRPQDLLGISPAVGLAALTLGAALADRVGVRLIGVRGALVPVVVALAGWGVALVVRVRERGYSR
jgi:hypothetical protein